MKNSMVERVNFDDQHTAWKNEISDVSAELDLKLELFTK